MSNRQSSETVSRKTQPRIALVLALIWAYISAVFLVEEPWTPLRFGVGLWSLSIIIVLMFGGILAFVVTRLKILTSLQLTNLKLFSVTLLISVMALDIGYSMYLNSTKSSIDVMKTRTFDQNVWVSELYPKVYYPTERNFALHKPNVTVSGIPYGNFYSEPMQKSPILIDSVLEKFPVTIRINELGFRESSDISATDIFTLGDSFTFGWGVNEEESWPELLESHIGQPVYNLGIHDASPKQELELLTYILSEQGDKIQIRNLLWMIYEGNDLEDDYTETIQRQDTAAKSPLLTGTVIDAVKKLMLTIKHQSVIHKLRHGQISWKHSLDTGADNPYLVDGVRLEYPLYNSEQLGPRLFYSYFIDLAGESVSYVDNHWNREALESVFRDMKQLADKYNFDVTVIMAPSAARLHGPYFDKFPEISEQPHFLNFVSELADSASFDTINLYDLFQPHAGKELFYFRDDDHFNHAGHRLTAKMIQQKLKLKQD